MTFRLSVITVLFTLLAVCGFAQTDTTTTVTGPQYSSGAFLGFNHYDAPQIKGGAFFDTKVAENMYNETTLNMTSKLATVTTGVKRFFYTTSTVGTVAELAQVLPQTSPLPAGCSNIPALRTRSAAKAPTRILRS